jgi:uncharacterized protein (DUF433 family)
MAKAADSERLHGVPPRKSRLAGAVALPETADVNQSVVKVDPEIMSGAPCFTGTRAPIQNLIDYLEGGDSIEEFLDGFPSVSREQVIAFLEEANHAPTALP